MTDAKVIRLQTVRRRIAEASTDFAFRLVGEGETLTARPIPGEEPYTVLTFAANCDYADREFICHAHADLAFVLELLDEAFAAIRNLRRALDKREPRKEYSAAQNCAAYCKDQAFQRWLHEVHGLDHPWDLHRAATKVRGLLGVDSRADLDKDQAAAERWHKLRADFKTWMKA